MPILRSNRRPGFLFVLTALLAESWVAHAQTSGAPVYACVQIEGNYLASFQILTEAEVCPSPLARMLVLKSKSSLFVANSSQPATEVSRVSAANFLTDSVSLTSLSPLTIAVSLKIDGGNGMYALPPPVASIALACVPTIDGQPAGAALPLAIDTGAVASRMEGTNPDTLWAAVRQYTPVLTGKHQLAMECQAGAPFHFRGVATLTVLQKISGN